jgi:hypothetical protein
LSYLDVQDKWVPNTFAVECLQTISYSLNNQHNQIMMTKVLQHLEIPHSTRVTQQIVATIVSIASESTGPVVIVLSSLMKLLISTIQQIAQAPPVPDVEEQLSLQQILIDCVGAVSKKFPSAAQKVEAMGFIIGLYEQSAARTHAGGFTLALVLAECVLAVGAHLAYLPSDCVPAHLFSSLLELSIHSDPTVRVYAQRIIHCLLLPGRSLGQLVSIAQGDLNSLVGSGCDDLVARHGPALRDSLLNAAVMRTNEPENYAAIFHTMAILLCRVRDKEVQYSIPLILKMQRKFQKKKRPPRLQARSLQTLVAAYLLFAARMYECKQLEDYVLEVIEQRRDQGQLCRYLELKLDELSCLKVKTKKYSEAGKHRSVSIFFDKGRVISALSTIPTLQQEYGTEKVQKILSRKFRTCGKVKHEESDSTYAPTTLLGPRGLPPLTPREVSNPLPDSETVKNDGAMQTAGKWPLAIALPDETKAKLKMVSADGLRKILEGRDHTSQVDNVTLLRCRDFAPVATRCSDIATERTSMYFSIMALALANDTVGSMYNMNGQDNAELEPPSCVSTTALHLDLLGPLKTFCD